MSPSELLIALQHGDSFFPSGGFASSWGLETLHAEGKVHDVDSLTAFLVGQLRYRWATCDRPALVFSHRAGDNLEHVAEIDAEIEALSLPRDLREASRRAGRAVLRVHSQLGTPNAASYLRLLKSGTSYGHVPVVQGLVWRGIGLDEIIAATLSGHVFCVATVSAAVRLNIISYVKAQEVLRTTRALLLELLPLPLPEALCSFTPAADIAMMRHEAQAVRLFAS